MMMGMATGHLVLVVTAAMEKEAKVVLAPAMAKAAAMMAVVDIMGLMIDGIDLDLMKMTSSAPTSRPRDPAT